MARKGFTGEGRVYYVPTITNTAAPTVAQITAGVDITPFLRRDGLSTPASGSTIDISDATTRQNKSAPGNFGGENVTLQLYRDDTTDTAWTTFPPDTAGYIVVRRFGGSSTAIAATQKVEVYPGSVITRAPSDIGDNEPQRFTVEWSVSGVVAEGTVAA